jgi:FAD/FMN-containing dehydrogenase
MQQIEDKYLHDWSGGRYGTPSGIALPADTAEVASLLRACDDARTPVAVQGGRTGVSGGAAPGDGEFILSLERLNRIEEFDTVGGIVVAGAGVILEDLQRMVEAQGWMFPVDLAARGSCQLGGNAATNAGGCRVVKYGNMRESVLGVEAVMANGAISGPPNRLVKNNAGYSLSNLLVGSEGTLGVITRLALRLVPLPPVRQTMLLALADHVAVDAVLSRARRLLGNMLSAFEAMWPDFIDKALQLPTTKRALPSSFKGRKVVLIELEGANESSIANAAEAFAESMFAEELVQDAVMAASSRDGMELWALRESVAEIQAEIRPYAGFDLGLDAKEHGRFVDAAKVRLGDLMPHVQSFFFGHVGDGNLHAVLGPLPTLEERALAERTLYEMLPPKVSSVTAEHGIGRKKKAFLPLSRSSADIETMKAIKLALDPNRILNPGRVFDL